MPDSSLTAAYDLLSHTSEFHKVISKNSARLAKAFEKREGIYSEAVKTHVKSQISETMSLGGVASSPSLAKQILALDDESKKELKHAMRIAFRQSLPPVDVSISLLEYMGTREPSDVAEDMTTEHSMVLCEEVESALADQDIKFSFAPVTSVEISSKVASSLKEAEAEIDDVLHDICVATEEAVRERLITTLQKEEDRLQSSFKDLAMPSWDKTQSDKTLSRAGKQALLKIEEGLVQDAANITLAAISHFLTLPSILENAEKGSPPLRVAQTHLGELIRTDFGQWHFTDDDLLDAGFVSWLEERPAATLLEHLEIGEIAIPPMHAEFRQTIRDFKKLQKEVFQRQGLDFNDSATAEPPSPAAKKKALAVLFA